jgi:polysaccharide export outer membrane protein
MPVSIVFLERRAGSAAVQRRQGKQNGLFTRESAQVAESGDTVHRAETAKGAKTWTVPCGVFANVDGHEPEQFEPANAGRNGMMRRGLFVFLAALAALLTVHHGPALAQTSVDQPIYQVGPSDVLKITVYGTDAYNADVQVSAEGTIPVNEIGEIAVGGLAPAQIAAKLAGEFRSRGILIDPVINVVIAEYRSQKVSVLGNVSRPGEYILDRSGLKLTDVLARSGAILGKGAGIVRITNANGTQTDLPAIKVMSGELDRAAQPNDTILVTEAPTFFILGEVQRPGSYPIEPGLTMERAIALAGGLTPRGSRSKLRVTRTNAAGRETSAKAKGEDEVLPSDLIRVGSRIF